MNTESRLMMNLNRSMAVVLAASLSLLAGCNVVAPAIQGSGVSKTETREVESFTKVEISIPVEIVITKGDAWTLEITMDENLLEHVTTIVEDGQLRVSSDQNLATKSPAVLKLTSPLISSVALAGSVKGTIEELGGEQAELDVAGSSTVEVGVQAEKFNLEIAGAGKVTTKGNCSSLDVSIAGSGTVHSESMTSKAVSVSIAGSGSVFVQAADSLEISIAGSGDVQYIGEPEIKQSVAGSGKISQLK